MLFMEQTTQRIRLLDILRGIAVLGTLGTNIWIFAYLGSIAPLFTIDHSPWESVNEFMRVIVLFLVNGKFLGLLTILLGAGLELKYRQSVRNGKRWPGMYIWVSVFLFVEGLLHFILVMEYDILMSYGVAAIIVSFIVGTGERAVKIAFRVSGGVHALFMLPILVGGIMLHFTSASISMGSLGESMALYQGGAWIDQVKYRLDQFLYLRSEAIFILPMNIFLLLLGVRFMRSGVFSDSTSGRVHRSKLIRIGLWVGVPLNLLIFIPGGGFDFPVRYLFAPIMSIGYLAIFAKMVERHGGWKIWSWLENAGRMSLSCYVLQNILATFTFYGWGLGLGLKLNSAGIVLVWLGIAMLQLLFARVWLTAFKHGPLEASRRRAIRLLERKSV